MLITQFVIIFLLLFATTRGGLNTDSIPFWVTQPIPSQLLLQAPGSIYDGYELGGKAGVPIQSSPSPNSPIVIWKPTDGRKGVMCMTYVYFVLTSTINNPDGFVVLPVEQYTPAGETVPTIANCVAKCAELAKYTYAGLQGGSDASCICFNNIKSVSYFRFGCSNCLYAYKRTIASTKGCAVDPLFPGNLYVMATCPDGYYGPPACLNRARPGCRLHPIYDLLDIGNVVMYNGTCTYCNYTDDGPYKAMSTYCDVLRPDLPIVDYRLSDPTGFNILKTNFLVWQDDFSTAVDDDTNKTAAQAFQQTKPENKISSNFLTTDFLAEAKASRAVSIKAARDYPRYWRDTVQNFPRRIYIMHLWFKARAKGAFYFSVWNYDYGYGSFESDRDEEGLYVRDEMSMKVRFSLITKHLIDVSYDGTSQMKNIYLPFYTHASQNPKFGYHSLDSQATWGGTGSMQENAEYNSLVCNTVYAGNYKLPDFGGINYFANYKNWYKRDTISGGWQLYEEVVAARSDRPWWSAHQYDVRNSLTGLKDHVGRCGLRFSAAHFDDCLMKIQIGVACSETCFRQQCNTDDSCIYGCICGYSGWHCMAPCGTGSYGRNCASRCSAGCISQTCDRCGGQCTDGCVAGLMGPTCDQTCNSGYFGQNCNLECSSNCINSSSCNLVDGTCYGGCKVGYKPPTCDLPCDSRAYGPNCTLACGSCKGGEACDLVTGLCRAGCDGNFMPMECKCLAGTWGPNCTKTCGNCKNQLPCRLKDGVCDGNPLPGAPPEPMDPTIMCSTGYQPPMCVCTSGKWGDSCQSSCGNCLSGFCMSTNGSCLSGCVPGYTGMHCTDKCTTGTWGPGCTKNCGSCQNRSNACDSVNGACTSGCAVGYKPSLCTDCAPGYWGPTCATMCGACRNKVLCLNDGSCPYVSMPPGITLSPQVLKAFELWRASGRNITIQDIIGLVVSAVDSADTDVLVAIAKYVCEDGYQPVLCVCKTGFYGPKCDQICSNCIAGCIENGTCLGGCVAGYYGPSCNMPCPNAFFGPNCKLLCGHCFNNTGCTAADGICKQGCDPGYMLPKCKCPRGYFGDDCKRVCGNCAEGTTCSFLDGSCQSGCQPGWKEPYCNCTVGTYRLDCSGKCGNCAGAKDCDFYTGNCQHGCNASYNMPLCVEKCPPGKFGPGCFSSCGKCLNCEICDPATGLCKSGCESGFLAPDCINTCPSGFYGSQCKQKCGYCYNDVPCNPVDGVCDKGCIMGYLSPYCTQPCPNKTWGFNCQNKCGNCQNGTNCNYLDGQCSAGCVIIYKPPLCVELLDVTAASTANPCKTGFYLPPACATPCGNCLGGHSCNGLVGYCPAGCAAGYQPIMCSAPCLDGLYGANCMQKCGHCAGTGAAAVCRKTDGVCTSGCVKGWFGDTCKYLKASDALKMSAENSCSLVVYSQILRMILMISIIEWMV